MAFEVPSISVMLYFWKVLATGMLTPASWKLYLVLLNPFWTLALGIILTHLGSLHSFLPEGYLNSI